MNRFAIVAACLAIAAPQAFAQAHNFEGFSVGINYEATRASYSAAGSGAGGGGSDNGTGNGLSLQAQYLFAVKERFVLGLGLTDSPTNVNMGSSAGNQLNLLTQNRSAIDFIGGIASSESTLVFLKLSDLRGTIVDGTSGASYAANGFGYGLGVRTLFDKHKFIQIGYDANTYRDVQGNGVTLSPQSRVISIGVGYEF